MTVSAGHRYAAEHYIHPDDREAFYAFVDPATLRERICSSERSYMVKCFRTRSNTGAFIWKAHYIVNVPDTDTYFYFTKYAPLTEDGHLETGIRGNKVSGIGALILDGIMESPSVNLFWKGRDRKFLGANQCFLNTYGLSGVEELIGKTDTDIGWNNIDDNLSNDEVSILNCGISIHNKPGRCIINGVTYDILITKEPLYQNGEIVGLWGMFTIVQDIAWENGSRVGLQLLDSVTGILSTRGILPIIIDYIEAYHIRGEDFAVITVDILRYKNGVESYGQKVVNKTMAKIGSILKEQVAYRGNCASIYGGMFVIYMKYREKKEIRTLVQRIRREITAVHQIDQYPITVRPDITVFLASEATDMQDLLWRTMLLSVFRNMGEYTSQYRAIETTRNILNRLPCAIAVFTRSREGKLTREYISEYAKKFTGRNDAHNAEQSEIMSIIHPDDLGWVQKRVTETVRANEGMDESYRVVSADGQVFWVRHTANAVPQPDGSCTFYVVYADITAEKEAEVQHLSADANRREISARIVNKLPCGVVAYSIAFNRRDIEYLYASEHVKDVLHLEISEKKRDIENLTKLVYEDDRQRIVSEVTQAVSRVADLHTQFRIVGSDGILRWFDFACTFDILPDDSAIGYVVYSDISERMAWEEEHLFSFEAFDTLPKAETNRRFRRLLEQKREQGYAMVMVDVDDLKYINDHFGHPVGDIALSSIVDILREVFRHSDVIGKIGGDEFMIFLDGFDDEENLRKKLQMIIEKTNEVLLVDNPPHYLHCSIGAIIADGQGNYEFDALYAAVDKALYEAKQSGKNRFVIRRAEQTDEQADMETT